MSVVPFFGSTLSLEIYVVRRMSSRVDFTQGFIAYGNSILVNTSCFGVLFKLLSCYISDIMTT